MKNKLMIGLVLVAIAYAGGVGWWIGKRSALGPGVWIRLDQSNGYMRVGEVRNNTITTVTNLGVQITGRFQ
jgi:hypothetical protein